MVALFFTPRLNSLRIVHFIEAVPDLSQNQSQFPARKGSEL